MIDVGDKVIFFTVVGLFSGTVVEVHKIKGEAVAYSLDFAKYTNSKEYIAYVWERRDGNSAKGNIVAVDSQTIMVNNIIAFQREAP